MNIHEEFIKKANKEIDKLTADIEKKKARISELRSEIKKHEVEKARDNDFSADLMKLFNKNGVTSDEERKALFSKIEEMMLEREIEKSEKAQNDNKADITENTAAAEQATVNNGDNSSPASTSNYPNQSFAVKS